ncbi:NADP-dependent oxidoreductase domain-containing protein [Hygrophoropsis aurantiaca]|uniref:NADP-dependent oxidoreductase domain-containing protein n=1 Tax=Hygrophoropsis aurantiaca TaxID=72124 RepID=A0ACB8AJP6_9AGAM|nr:NADP-dependent oxidoreductase domain-containing protein [Hygrophoropsis aurantiaca]
MSPRIEIVYVCCFRFDVRVRAECDDIFQGAGAFSLPVDGASSGHGRCNTIQDAQQIIDLFVRYSETNRKIDTSRIYGAGTSEQMLAKIDIQGCSIDTKVNPKPGDFAPIRLRSIFLESVEALKPHKIHTFYLHLPDRSVPIEETLRAVNDLYLEGYFEEFGLSNYNSWEVAQIVCIAQANGWIKPTVYQGLYNAVERNVEVELIPCLRTFGIRFYAYSPLASGVLTGKILTEAEMSAPGGRWDPKVSFLAGFLQGQYGPMLPAVRELKEGLDKHNIPLSEAAHRWLQHHSVLSPEHGDTVIIGASNIDQLENNLRESERGSLPEEVVTLIDAAWKNAKAHTRHYAF